MNIFIISIIVVALIFDYVNGFHDSANSISTVVSTRVLTPFQAVLWAAFFNFVAAFGFRDVCRQDNRFGHDRYSPVTPSIILAGLLGAIIWDLYTVVRLADQFIHALIGGYAGSAIAAAGWKVIIVAGWTKRFCLSSRRRSSDLLLAG